MGAAPGSAPRSARPGSARPGSALPGSARPAPLDDPARPRLTPLSWLALAVCGVVCALVAGGWVAAALLGLALVVGVVRRRARGPVLVGLGVGASATAGLMLMYAPFGEVPGWWLLTRDGTTTAALLGLKYTAAASTGLALGSFVHFGALMRQLQPCLPARLVYVLGATFRLLPMARVQLGLVRESLEVRGVRTSGVRGYRLVLPLIVNLVDAASARSYPLQQLGFDLVGPRTVLRPVVGSWRDVVVMALGFGVMVVVIVGSLR